MLYISTTSIINNKNLFTVLERYNKLGIRSIELGSVHNYISDFKPLFKFQKDNDINFIIHGFFPPLKEKFFINLSSQNGKILKKSIDSCKKSVEMCRKLNSSIYTTHSGFSRDIIPNKKMKYGIGIASKEYDKEIILNTLNKSITEICDYANNYDIKIAIETMNSDRKMTIMDNPIIIDSFFKNIKLKNLFLLFDTGHMKANSVSLNFDFKEAVKKLKKYIIALHLQDNTNNGEDEHLPIKNTEILDLFGKDFLKDKYITLEGQNNWTEKDILDSRKLVEGYIS